MLFCWVVGGLRVGVAAPSRNPRVGMRRKPRQFSDFRANLSSKQPPVDWEKKPYLDYICVPEDPAHDLDHLPTWIRTRTEITMRGVPASTCTLHNPPRKGTWARDSDSYQKPIYQTNAAHVRRPLGHPEGGPPLDTCKQSTQARRPLPPRSNGPDLERMPGLGGLLTRVQGGPPSGCPNGLLTRTVFVCWDPPHGDLGPGPDPGLRIGSSLSTVGSPRLIADGDKIRGITIRRKNTPAAREVKETDGNYRKGRRRIAGGIAGNHKEKIV
ncbi:hypothetical protein AgCh_017837 [Apium graveolens]